MNKQTFPADTSICLHRRFLASYRKNTLAIFLSFTLTFLLSTVLLVLIHTNHRVENLDYQTIFTSSDCYIEDLTKEQITLLKKNPAVLSIAVSQWPEVYQQNQHMIYLDSGDPAYLTLTATLLEGKFPEAPEAGSKVIEVAAEKWVLLNLGIEPVLNQEFVIQNASTEEEQTVRLVGILSDLPGKKSYGTLSLYKALNKEIPEHVVYLRFRDTDYTKELTQILKELGIQPKEDRVNYNPAREDYQELFWIDVQILAIVVFVCMIVFYGVYRIALITREKQYGILRAVGMKRTELRAMILLELYQIYLAGAPVGIALGLLLAWIVVQLSGDTDTIIYLYNEAVRFVPVVPVKQIFVLFFIVAALVGLVGCGTARSFMKRTPVELLSYGHKMAHAFPFFRLKKNSGKLSTLLSLSCKYILKDIRTSCFVILTIGTGVVLFTGLAYQARILKLHRDSTKEMRYLNGQYEMSMSSFGSTCDGIARADLERIRSLDGVSQIKTCSALPVRIIDEGTEREEDYYDFMNSRLLEYQGFELRGHDGTDPVYRSNLYGYNTEALKELKKYVISGDFDAVHGPAKDEVILAVLSIGEEENDTITTGWYPEGEKVMRYQVGDRIQVKYRADLQTNREDYIHFTDSGADYSYKEYRVIALVSFPYMDGCDRSNIYPMLITSDQYLKHLVPESHYQCIYIDGKPSMTPEQQDTLERQLIQIGRKSGGVSTRSLISDIRRNEQLFQKQLIYVCGIAIITFILVLINMLNNLRYRMQTRTQEVCMLRAVGISVTMVREIMIFENEILGCIAILAAYLLSWPVLGYLYSISEMELYGYHFFFDYRAFLWISGAALLLCGMLSGRILTEWKSKRIMEGIGKVE